jgi:hypothetical protein
MLKNIKSIVFLTIIMLFSANIFAAQGLNKNFKLSNLEHYTIVQDLIKFEGDDHFCTYTGKNGAITIGVGSTLSTIYDVTEKVNGKTISYKQTKIWSLDEINDYFRNAGVTLMTPAAYNQLKKLRDTINKDLKNGKKPDFQGQSKEWNYCLKKNDNRQEMYKLLDYSIKQHVELMIRRADILNIDLRKLDSLAIVMVMDMVYRAGTGIVLGDNTPKANNALRNKNYLALLQEFYAYSNKNDLEQNDLRNAFLVAQSLELLKTESDKKAFKDFVYKDNQALEVANRINTLLENKPNSMDHDKIKVMRLAVPTKKDLKKLASN